MSQINRGIGSELGQNMELIITAVLAIVVSFYINWELTLIVVGVMPVIAIGIYIFTKVCNCLYFDHFNLFT